MFRRFLFLMFFLALACTSFATVFGTVRGIVHDPQHRPVPDVSVKLKSATSDSTQTAVTDQDGTFTFSAVPVGDYLVTVTKSGFKPSPWWPIPLLLSIFNCRSVR